MSDQAYIKRCLELAKQGAGYTSPNPLVGCVIVKDGEVISEGYHHKFGHKHAEIDAFDKLDEGEARGATLYVNLEPCSFKGKTGACTDRILIEGIKKVVFGSKDLNSKVEGEELLEKTGVEIIGGILEEECDELNQFFNKWITTGEPYVTLKIAQTSDHFIAYPDGNCPHITNEQSRTFVHEMRAWYDAVLIGKGTLESDDSALTIRHITGRLPFRIVLDSQAELISSSKKILTDEHSKKTIWVVDENVKFENPHGVEIIRCKSENSKINIKDLLGKLAKKNISSVFVEGGPQVWQSFLDADVVDQLQIFTADKKFGKGIQTLPKSNLSEINYEKAEELSFGSDRLEIKYLKIY